MNPNEGSEYAKQSIAITLARTVAEYFKDPKHRDEFKVWHLQYYGEEYEFNMYGGKRSV